MIQHNGMDHIKLIYLDITGYRIKYSTVLWLLELHIRHGGKFQTQVHTVSSNSRTANCQCRLFSKKNPIIRIICIFGRLAAPINPDNWSFTVLGYWRLGSETLKVITILTKAFPGFSPRLHKFCLHPFLFCVFNHF